MTVDSSQYRATLSQFATGVCIVTAPQSINTALGVTINSFASVSLQEPLILFCLKRVAQVYPKLMSSPGFCVNVLSSEQKDLALRCTRRGGGIIEASEYEKSAQNIPLLKGALANIECVRQTTHKGGDHTIVLGKVMNLKKDPSKDPLVFFQSQFMTVDRAALTEPEEILLKTAS